MVLKGATLATGNTRERIVDTAIALFNERGTHAVSTNHIAEALGISPGNLYYHFRNKEEIILAGYEKALVDFDAIWVDAGLAAPSPEAMFGLMEGTFEVEWRYRFFQREAPALVQADPRLAERYRTVQRQRLALLRTLVDGWVAAGVLAEMDEDQRDDLATATYVLGESWVGWLEATGAGNDQHEFRRGVRLMREIVRPHLKSRAGGDSGA